MEPVDVILRDGGTLRLRAPRADDADGIVGFFSRLSDRSRFQRFHGFADAGERFARTLVDPDWDERGALVGVAGEPGEETIIGVGNYVRLRNRRVAEAAFAVADDWQRRGVGTRLLEQLASRAGESGIDAFVAEVLADNASMLAVFENIGFKPTRTLEGGVVEVRFPIAKTVAFTDRVDQRDHVAVTASLRPFFEPRSVAVVGASPRRGSIGGELFRNILTAGFTGSAYPVNRGGEPVGGVRAFTTIAEIGETLDLIVICVPGEHVLGAAEDALRHGTKAICVISAGFAETGPEGRQRQNDLLALVRAHGARLVGAELPRDRLGRGRSQRHLRATRLPAGPDRVLVPERRARARTARARRSARARRLVVRLDRQQGGRLVERPARMVGGRREHRSRADVPRVVRKPAEVRPARAAALAREADPRDEERKVALRPSGRGLAHRSARRIRRGGGCAVPTGGSAARGDAG